MTLSSRTPGGPVPAADGLRPVNVWVLPLAAGAQLLLALDFAIVNVALSTIQRELRFPAAGLAWVATGYALTFGALLMTGGRLGDRFGLKRVLLIGLTVFGLASLSGGLALTAAQLVVSRLVQGAGAALVAPTALALVAGAYPDGAARARAVSLFQGSNAVGGLLGVVLGGLLTGSVGWRWVLLVNPPVVVVIIVLVGLHIPTSTPSRRATIDGPGSVTLTVGVAALILGVTGLEQRGPADVLTWAPLAVALVSGAAFVLVERRGPGTMLPAASLRDGRWAVLLATCLLGGTMAGYAYFLARYLQRVLHLSAATAGFAFLPATLTGLVSSTVLAPRLLPRLGARRGLVLALALLALGQLWLSRLPEDGSYVLDVLTGVVPTAVGLGLAFPAAALLLTEGVAPDQRGVASALFSTGQQIGAAVGLAVLATVAALHTATPAAGYDRAFAVATGMAAGAAVLAAVARPGRTRHAPPHPSATSDQSRKGPSSR